MFELTLIIFTEREKKYDTIEMSIKTTTSINQIAASAKYYNKNKKEINEKRKVISKNNLCKKLKI